MIGRRSPRPAAERRRASAKGSNAACHSSANACPWTRPQSSLSPNTRRIDMPFGRYRVIFKQDRQSAWRGNRASREYADIVGIARHVAPPAAQRRSLWNSGRSATHLAEMLEDQREHWRRGEPLAVEEYVRRHPELANQPEALLDLIVQEYFCRKRRGETPELDEFLRRFPLLAGPLQIQFAWLSEVGSTEDITLLGV